MPDVSRIDMGLWQTFFHRRVLMTVATIARF